MKKEISLILFLNIIILSLEIYNKGENWAILACGSSGYINYRHQADVFHVYQSLLKRGFSKNHIILFAYDDIAYHPKNPFPGEVYNRPDGPNVYDGIIIDYSDYYVNPENYLSVLKGDTQNGKLKKVLNSTENDNIFLYFSDHGIAGAIVFPNSKFLYADELEETFKYMKDKKMYKNIIFYLESCYSGSMFNNINQDLNIYSMTAASPNEQSLATYCFPQDFVKGEEMHTCLSNEFTSNWLDDSDSRIILNEDKNNKNKLLYNNLDEKYSSHEQFILVKNLTKSSNVQEYGNLLIGDLPITHFQSSKDIYNENHNNNEDKKERTKEEEEYDEIKRKIIDFDFDLDDEDEDFFNSYKKNKNYLDDDEFDEYDLFDIIYKINYDELKINNEKYNYISYIIDRNKYMRKIEENNYKKILDNKNDENDENDENNNLRGQTGKNKDIKKVIKDTKYNLLSTYVKLFYLELDISQTNDFHKYLEFQKEMKEIEKTKKLFELLKLKLNIPDNIDYNQKIDYKCLRFSIQLFKDECGIDERDLEYISLFSYECSKIDVNTHIIKDSIIELCKDKKDGLLL